MCNSIAIIGAGVMAEVYAVKAREMNIDTHCFAWPEGAEAKDMVDYFYPISIFEMDTILEICREKQIGGVVCTTELTIPVASYIAEKMGLHGIPYELAKKISNKSWIRNTTSDKSLICHPKFKVFMTLEDVKDWSVFPAIMKPASEGGKRGIVVVDSKEELIKEFAYSKSFDKHDNGVIIEEYIPGDKEYSVEGISFEGQYQLIQITEKISSGPPHCVELGHLQPAELKEELYLEIEENIEDLLRRLSYTDGATHVKIKINDNKIFLVELNARIGGDFISSPLVELSTGYDYIGELIKCSLGISPLKFVRTKGRYSGVYFVVKQSENLKAIFDKCDDKDWLYEKHVETDELIELQNNNHTHINYMIYCSDHKITFDETEDK